MADDWAVQTLETTDGIGAMYKRWACVKNYTFAAGQMGNSAGKHYTVADGATALAFSSNLATYNLSEQGNVFYTLQCTGRTANGADGTSVQVWPPILMCPDLAPTYGLSNTVGKINNKYFYITSPQVATYIYLYYWMWDGADWVRTSCDDDYFVNANDWFGCTFMYKVFSHHT